MKFDTSCLDQNALSSAILPGNVYRAKGGSGNTVYWLVVSVSANGRSVHMLGLDREGFIVSTASYGDHAVAGRALVGHCTEFNDKQFVIVPASQGVEGI